MYDIVNRLRKHGFPQCARIALEHLETSVQKESPTSSIPGLTSSTEDFSDSLIEEFIFCHKQGKTGMTKKLNAIQELQLLEILMAYFQKKTDNAVSQSVFRALFGGQMDAYRRELLYKLISMAISVKNKNLLECAAAWMQRQGCGSDMVLQMTENLVQDYCVLVPGASSIMADLPSLSQHFTCNFITAATTQYQPKGQKGSRRPLPLDLLEVITDWIRSDTTLCLVSLNQGDGGSFMAASQHRSSLWTSPTKPNTQTPIPGLVRWCTQAPIGGAGPPEDGSGEQLSSEALTWSKLHLAVLQTFTAFQTLQGANQLELLTLTDMNRIVKESANMVHQGAVPSVNQQGELTQPGAALAMDRLVQILQVSLATGAFRCSLSDLQSICNNIPRNRLLDILQMQHLARTPPPMHHESR